MVNTITGDLGNIPEISVFETFKTKARGGCIHEHSSEHICVLVGEIYFVYGFDSQTRVLSAGESITIPQMTPHYFLSLVDSVVMEFGPQMEEKNKHYQPFRQIVEEINENPIQ